MVQVVSKEGEPVQKLIRRFRRKVERAGIRGDARRKRHYLKPSERKREKRRRAEKRRRKELRRRGTEG